MYVIIEFIFWMFSGETAIGKTSLIESLFKRQLGGEIHNHESERVCTEVQTHDLKDGNVKLKLTIVSSVGFGDQLDRSNSADALVSYIDQQFEDFLQEELKIAVWYAYILLLLH